MGDHNKVKIGEPGIRGKVSYEFTGGDGVRDRGRANADGGDSDIAPVLEMVKNEATQKPVPAGDSMVAPWGPDNRFPNKLRFLFENNLVPGLIDFKADMVFGTGYTLVNERGEQETFADEHNWLDSWDVFDYLLSQATDYVVYQNVFGQVRRMKNGKTVDYIQPIAAQECRVGIDKEGDPTHIVVGVYDGGEADEFDPYPIWNRFNDVKAGELSHDIVMYQCRKPTSGFRFYSYPVYIGAVNSWIPVANQIPRMHAALLRNTMMATYHVKIPMEPLAELARKNKWTEEKLQEWVDNKMSEIDDMVCGAENAGKTFYTYTIATDRGQKVEWEISLIDNKLKEMSESHLRLFNDCNQALTSAFQVPPSLASIQLGEKLSSGSEVLNSFNFYVKTRTPIARKIITDPINAALRINFPKTRARLVFQDVTLVHQDSDKTGIEPQDTKQTPDNEDTLR